MPTIISDGGGAAASISLSEDRRGVTRVVATDPNPGAITYSIVGGEDQTPFAINAMSGLLSLVNVPNFEAPEDLNGDNAYVVQVQASNGGSTATQTITVNVTDVNDITGTPGADLLIGTSSGEVLAGLGGPDQLLGNEGHDTFLINSPSDGIVSLLDFWPEVDIIGLDQIGFGIAGNGSLAINGIDYVVGSAANISAPTIIFDPVTSSMLWDADGIGATAPVAFARYAAVSTVFWTASVDVGPHPGGAVPAGLGDFDADGMTDLAWYNSATNAIEIWKLDNGQWAGSFDVGTHPPGYQPVGFGDYDNDGTDDVLWFNPTTRDVDLWKISNGQWAGSVNIGTHPGVHQPTLTGDFNGDGTSDIAWYDPTTNAIDIWKLNNGQWTGSVDVGPHPAGWQPALAGDFDGDGTSDIAWYNPTTNAIDIWKIVNGQWAGSVDVGSHPAGWQLLEAADFDLNGTSDIVWHNPTINNIDIWLMANGQWSNSTNVGANPGPVVPVGVGDFDHNGVSDVMWRDPSTGAFDTWLLAKRPPPAASNFNIEGNIVPNVSIPVDTDGAANSVVEGAANGTTVGLTASFTNPSGAPVTYSLSDSAGGRFAINASTGVVTVANGPLVDFENSGVSHSFSIIVTATSGALTSSGTFSIGVSDVNDTAPVLTSSATPSVAENTTAVITLAATDADTVGTFPPTFTISGGADAALFTITGGNQLAFISAPDFETQAHSYVVQVTANDGVNQTIQDLTVTLTDTNDTAPVLTSSATPSVAENTTAVITLAATDADTVGTFPPTFTISGGADAALFTITGGNQLAFISAPDFENPTDNSANNVYDVTVQASDGVNSNVLAIAITVTNVSGSFVGTSGSDTIVGTFEEDTIDGLAGIDTITGGAGADVLTGGLGADIFVIGAVADLAAGETINGTTEAATIDTLRLNAAGTYNLSTFTTITNIDAVAFNVNAAGFNLTVADSQVLTADANGDGTQNDLQISAALAMTNGVTISAAGLTGTNRITVVGTNLGGADTITGGAGDDIIDGGAGIDTITGGAGIDTITGGAGADVLTGGLGADIFVVGAVADLAAGETINGTTEAATIDTLRLNAAGTYNLSTFTTITNIDAVAFNVNAAGFNLTVADSQVSTADANGDGTQNDLQISAALAMTNGVTISAAGLTGTNRITVVGTNLGGADTITGGAGDDIIDGGAGIDTITGGAGIDTITGGAGIDTITGGAGADVLTGGLGADIFVVGAVADLAAGETINGTTEAATIDTLRLNAAGTYNLSTFTTITNIDAVAFNVNAAGFNLTVADSQVLTADANGDGTQNDLQISAALAMTNGVTISAAGLTGTNRITVVGTNLGGADTITGGAGDDIIDGGAGIDTITGGAGIDTITGGAGADVLTGGLGEDHFKFNIPTEGIDQITDFSAAEADLIDILVSAFGGGLTTGTNPSTVFGTSTTNTFTSSTERFHYNTTTHTLFFDVDGSGASAAQTLAVFSNGVALAASDLHFL